MTPAPLARILVLPRSRAAALDLWCGYAVVSINDPGDVSPFEESWSMNGLLPITFCDVGADAPHAMKCEDAERVAEFVRRLEDAPDVEVLVIQCFAGVSRSISLAFAVADHFNLGRACIDWRMKPHGIHDDPPNAHVYGLVRAALKGEAT